MRNRVVASVAALTMMTAIPLILQAQTPAAPPAAVQSPNRSLKVPDLSGTWRADNKRGGLGQSISLADPDGARRGKEGDIPYQSWALAKTLSEKPSSGPGASREDTTDPSIQYCEPIGIVRIQMQPGAMKFVQTPELVYIFYERGPNFQMVRLNGKHPDDPDPLWWGDSIGWYENGDTLVVDLVVFKDKTWLDEEGHPETEQLHLVERYKRVNANTLELDMTIDDPGAYTKPFHSHRNFARSKAPLQQEQVCSTR